MGWRRLHVSNRGWVLGLAPFGLALALGGVGCADDGAAPRPPLFFPSTEDELPASLSEWGVFPGAPAFDDTPEELVAYEPRFPLWTNGSVKIRHLALPPGADAPEGAALEAGAFPPGTLFLKTFAYPTVGDPDQLRPLETRVMLRRVDGAWGYGSYLWNAEGTDAVRRSMEEATPVEVTPPNGEPSFAHLVPSRDDCLACHERSASVVLGYDALQLGRAPLPETVETADPTTREVVGYAVGNCTSCHNDETPDSLFDLGPAVFLESVIGQETTTGRLRGAGIRVVPGQPEDSFLYLALTGGDPFRAVPAMPPLGVERLDERAVDLFRSWIEGLPGED
ncbi:MAG TPA: hypothetical protein RMF84_00560 [Polyangiaceae bacterium LLY-WYZ-14_1]|nr:hypothetical protein [Polyangiaceae bacterium LLY-WYZ-14_1]